MSTENTGARWKFIAREKAESRLFPDRNKRLFCRYTVWKREL